MSGVFFGFAMSPDPKDGPNAITPDTCWRVLEAVASSSYFKRAVRLKEFLLYVGRKSIKEGCCDLHEQEIGQTVFGRRDAYDTSQDNIVRVSATELRKRVDAYFAAEGKDEPLIFEIPRGSYTPIFRLRAVDTQVPGSIPQPNAATVTNLPGAVAPSRGVWLLLLLVSAVAVLLAIACVVLWLQNRSLRKMLDRSDGQPALSAFWPHFMNSSQDTDVVLADTSLSSSKI